MLRLFSSFACLVLEFATQLSISGPTVSWQRHFTTAHLLQFLKLETKFTWQLSWNIGVFAWGKGGTDNNPNDGNAGEAGNEDQAGNNDQPKIDIQDEAAGNENINDGTGVEEGSGGGEEVSDEQANGAGVEGNAQVEAREGNDEAANLPADLEVDEGNDEGPDCPNTANPDQNSNNEQEDGWGSRGDHGDGYGLGVREGNSSSSEESHGRRNAARHQMHIDEAVNLLHISNHSELTERDLKRIYRQRMMAVHPDRTHITGLTVEEIRRHMNLPQGRNGFDPFEVDDRSDEERD